MLKWKVWCVMNVIEEAKRYVKNVFENDFSGHDYFHTLRVYNTALTIAQREQADLLVVSLAALLHDVDDEKLSKETYKNKDRAVSFMKNHQIDEDIIQRVIKAIEEVSFVGSDSVTPSTIEGMCVQDADRLDAIGAIGIARCFAYGGAHHRVIYDPDEKPMLNMTKEQYRSHVSTTVNHFYEKLFLLKNMMNTVSAKKIAEDRHEYMEKFMDEFLNEWEGKA